MADERDYLEPDEPHHPDDVRSSLSDEYGLEPHLNGVHGYRLNDLMGMSYHVQEQLHRDAHQREVRVAEVDTVATLLTERAELRADIDRLKILLRSQMVGAGPYMLTQWTDDIRHVDPCDCDLDDETAGDACMANSEWDYAVVVDGGAFAPRLILKLPKRAPEQPEFHDGPPLTAVDTDHLGYLRSRE